MSTSQKPRRPYSDTPKFLLNSKEYHALSTRMNQLQSQLVSAMDQLSRTQEVFQKFVQAALHQGAPDAIAVAPQQYLAFDDGMTQERWEEIEDAAELASDIAIGESISLDPEEVLAAANEDEFTVTAQETA